MTQEPGWIPVHLMGGNRWHGFVEEVRIMLDFN
jgi:hypothetical protein